MTETTELGSLELSYAPRFKYVVGLSILIFSGLWIWLTTDLYGYLTLALVLAALMVLLFTIGLFSSKPVIELNPKAIRDFRHNRQRTTYDWRDFSAISIKNYSRAGYYFVCHGAGPRKTIRFPVGLWNASGRVIAEYIENATRQSESPIELDFSALYATGFDSL